MDDIIDVLASVEIFVDLDRDRLETIAKRCRRDKYTRQQIIFGHGDMSADVYFIASGRVGITAFSQTGKEIAFRQLKRGEMFGDIAAIDRQPRSTAVVSLSDVELLRLSDNDFLTVLHEMPDVSLRAMQRLTYLVRALSERVFEYTTYGVRNRIHAELLRLAKATGQPGPTINIHPSPTHAEIANQISTHREAVTREFSRLASTGIIKKRGRNLIIHDIASLEALVDEVK